MKPITYHRPLIDGRRVVGDEPFLAEPLHHGRLDVELRRGHAVAQARRDGGEG